MRRSFNAPCAPILDSADFSSYSKCVRFKFDADKDRLTIAHHGLSLAFAEQLVWDEALVWIDRRFRYDELRLIALAA